MLKTIQHSHSPAEHPEDVLRFQLNTDLSGTRCALAMITHTIGGAVRAPGAIMAITEHGERVGYLSGGCIDSDIALHAQTALRKEEPMTIQYGQGSPFLDIALPCGGGITVAIAPRPDGSQIKAALTNLTNRKGAKLTVPAGETPFTARYVPKLKLRIAGRSADPIALAKLAIASDIQTSLWSADQDCLNDAKGVPELQICVLTSPNALPEHTDDAHTAFVLMMHDRDWETALLRQALSGPAFYIGAVGSPKTHKTRCDALAVAGLSKQDIHRVRGPIGLVPSMRNASTLAISTLAEIISSRQVTAS